jgi:hypothetical protein
MSEESGLQLVTDAPVPPAPASDLRSVLLARAARFARLEKLLFFCSSLAALGFAAVLCARTAMAVPSTPPAGESPRVRSDVSIYGASSAPAPSDSKAIVESESEAEGFVLLLETVPDGALASVDGVRIGETPTSLNPECAPGAALKVVLTHAGYAPLTHTVTCRSDRMLVLKAHLKALRPRK